MRITLFLLFILFGPQLQGQHRIGVSYFGENYTHPGALISHTYLLKEKPVIKTNKKGKEKVRTYEFLWQNRIGFYNHRRNHLGLLAAPGISVSRITQKGFFVSMGVYSGASYSFLNEDTYEVDANGEVTKVSAPGNASFIAAFGTRTGKDFSYKNPNRPFRVFLGMNILYSTPYNTAQIWRTIIEVGVVYKLKNEV